MRKALVGMASSRKTIPCIAKLASFAALGLTLCLTFSISVFPDAAFAVDTSVPMYRLYNRNTGEHFYTASAVERDACIRSGWVSEGIGWNAPMASSTPVYRLYNSHVRGGDHHYTTSAVERDSLIAAGWTYEGIGWYSGNSGGVPIYRQYNPNAATGTHNYTTSVVERTSILSAGWRDEGVGWYGVGTPIMGATSVTSAQLATYYRSVVGESAYPSSVYASKGAAAIDDFCRILVEEANAEGVRAEVVFVQAMKETGWLRFGGAVRAEWCNFAGLGAVNSSPTSAAQFPDVRTGLRAQVQHLKAYATTDSLSNACVDPRFDLVTRGCAPTLEGLNGKWAVPGNGYGESLASMIDNIMASL